MALLIATSTFFTRASKTNPYLILYHFINQTLLLLCEYKGLISLVASVDHDHAILFFSVPKFDLSYKDI